MVKSASLAAALTLDTGFRRVVLPLVLLVASIFRYNVASLLYFTCMLVSVFLPHTGKKKDRVPSLVLTIFLIMLSLFMTLAQPLFQISLATDYDDELDACSSDEKIWRQFGFIPFDVRGSDVLRNYLPDVIVLVLSVFSGIFLLLIYIAEKRLRRQAETAKQLPTTTPLRDGVSSRDTSVSPAAADTNLLTAGVMPSSDPNILHRLESSELPVSKQLSPDSLVQEFGAKIEERSESKRQRLLSTLFARLPILYLLSLSWKSFYLVFLWFTGICVACVMNFVYFACSIYLSLGWALHLNQTRLFTMSQKVLIVVISLYSAVHLIILYLYQFQSAQDLVPRPSVTARVLGFTGIIRTDCNQTTVLLTHTSLEWPIYVNPISLLIVFWMSTTELRHLLFQEKTKSKRSHRSKRKKAEPTMTRTNQNNVPPMELQGIATADEADDDDNMMEKKKKHIIWTADDSRKILESLYAGLKWLMQSFMEVNFVFSLVAMMVWSVVFPSWTSFVLLMWSCIVWVTPRFNAKDTVYYTTPLLVLYAIVLLLIQYLYNLDLTEGELESNIYAGLTRYNSPPDGARVLAIGIKSLCTAVFLSSLFEFMQLHKSWWYAFLQRHCKSADVTLESGVTGLPEDSVLPTVLVADRPDAGESSLLARALRSVSIPDDPYKYLRKYWIIVTTGAFLLVILVGEVTLFKVVFMIFFLLFIFAYQFFPRNWYRIMEPLWTILIFYAFIELTIIYTYQFSYVREVWIEALNSSHNDLSVDEVLESIGFFEVSIDTLSFVSIKDLFVTIIPSAVFVAVLALQLKYFGPREEDYPRRPFEWPGEATHRQISFVQMADQPAGVEEEESTNALQAKDDDTDLTNISPEEAKNKHIQDVIEKYWSRVKIVVRLVNEFLWRLLEIYLPKVIIFVIFTVLLDEISATHFLVFAILIIAIPINVNPIMYLILTGIISNLTLLKMLYQVALVDQESFRFSDSCPNVTINPNAPLPRGAVYFYKYDRDDPAWLGFRKVECEECSGFFGYIKWDIAILLLIALSYAVSRRQQRCMSDVNISRADKRSLFWGITSEDADGSIVKGFAYLINHVFDFYGLEICWSMLAIAVAVRTDIFGVLYAVALGIFLITPQRGLRLVWLLYLVAHGCLLLIQYAMLVGAPYGSCIDDRQVNSGLTLPWNDIEPVGLKRWLWLPIANDEYFILKKDWLWADVLVYIVVSFQFYNLRRSLDEVDTPGPQFAASFLSFATSKKLTDHVKRVIYKHFFWVTLFIVFVAGTSQVSLLGLLYLFTSFSLLWQGQEMLRYPKAKLRRWWFFLLLGIWFVLIAKISFQLYTCVYFEKDIDDDCIVVRLFNVRCEAASYYEPPIPIFNRTAGIDECPGLPFHVGIWLDVFAFVFVILQIVIFSSDRFESIRAHLLSKESLAESKHATGDLLDKINEELEKERENEKVIKENIKKRLLEVRDKYKTSLVEHYLRAGVQLPDHIEFDDGDDPVELGRQFSLLKQDAAIVHDDESAMPDQVGTSEDEIVHSKVVGAVEDTESKDGSEVVKEKQSAFQGIWKLIGNGLSFIDSGFVLVINYLRGRSKYYRYLAKRRKERKNRMEEVELNAVRLKRDSAAEPSTTSPDETAEITLEATKHIPRDPSINSYDAAINGDQGKTTSPIDLDNDDEIEAVDDGVFRTRKDVLQVWRRLIQRPFQFVFAFYYAALANTEYICYFLVVMNVIVNGSVLSLVYAAMMFLWGLLSIPWPTKRFWLSLMFYTMFVILVKYAFQFYAIDWPISQNSGLYWPQVLGVEKRADFLDNIVWDILLLISLFFHRSLQIDTGRWSIAGDGYLDILPFNGSDGTSAIRLILRPRSEILESLSSKKEDEGSESYKTGEQEASKSLSEVSSSEDDDSDEPGLLSYIFKVISLNVKYFYRQVVSQDISLGAHDYYTISFFMDAIGFIIIAVGFSSFGLGSNEGASGVNTVASYIQENNVPIPFLAMLFAHFMSMVIDRAIYLRKSVLAKLSFFLFQLVAWHVWLFFILPLPTVTARSFTNNNFAQALYFFKCQYFIFSAQQCVSGFPKRVLGYFISKRYNLLATIAFQVYRAIPILPDLKEVMDWMFTETSLKLFHWLKVQEIWAQLYLIKNLRKREKNDPRVLGQPEGFVIKLLVGGGLLVLLILLIWGPLLVIALVNTTNVSNPPVEVSIQLTLGSFAPLLSISAGADSLRRLSSSSYNDLSNEFSSANRQRAIFRDSFKREDFTQVTFQGNSTALWDISPPSREVLMMALVESRSPIPLTFSWHVSREPETGLASEIVSGLETVELPQNGTIRVGIYELLSGSNSGFVNLTNLYPEYIYAPANGPSVDLNILSRMNFATGRISLQNRTITDSENVTITQEWWSLTASHQLFEVENSSDVMMVFYSERVSQPIFSFIAGLGIIGLYVSVVLVIGRALRSYIAGLPSRITFNEIPNPDNLLELCDDIFYVREDGNLQEEEILVGRLFFIFRSPARLIQLTKWKKD